MLLKKVVINQATAPIPKKIKYRITACRKQPGKNGWG
jgi:hypothetical protein